ncbi:arrestin domain-containing protein 2-like [Hyalella azteca]|uniref:Arrestin domain-containing protein 2-like n=1 Tax=Hyalella azteca TaxID=294128 RepID=A0A979FNG6_HYAAZ|nr:arrestin domain-containing protein 2-like [Hyalella azteca]
MGLTNFTLVLEPHQDVYFPGQAVEGRVMAVASSARFCRAVEVEFRGDAEVSWDDVSDSDDDATTYEASEPYFKFKTNVWEPDSSGRLPAGNHDWPFKFKLPLSIPSSFEGRYGYIRYRVKAVARIRLGFNKESEVYISVNCPLDLTLTSATAQLLIEKEDTSCLCRGPVSLYISGRRYGAVVGEKYRVRGEVANYSRKKVESTILYLRQRVTYHSKRRRTCKVDERDVKLLEIGCVAPGDSIGLQDEPFFVPSVVPGLQHCQIMDLKYFLKVVARFDCCNDVSGQVEFVVGTIPFLLEGGEDDRFRNFPNSPMAPASNNTSSFPQVETFTPGSSDLNPPSFFLCPNEGPSSKISSSLPPGSVPVGFPEPVPLQIMQFQLSKSLFQQTPASQHPNQSPSKTTPCYFCQDGRPRMNRKCPPPSYLSYLGCI